MNNRTKLGQKVHAYLRERGVTQEAFANKIGISPKTLSQYIRGKTEASETIINRIAEAIDCTPDDLLGSAVSGREQHINRDKVDELIDAAQTIIDNAESIVGTEKTLCSISVTIYLYAGEAPRINIDRDIYPERLCGFE